MGCAGSKPATPEESQEIAKEACKMMLTKIVPQAIESPQEVKIPAPEKELASIKKMATDLRAASAEAKQKVGAAGHHAAENVDKLAQQAGGVVGSFLHKAAGAVESVVDKTAEVAGGGLETALAHIADTLDKQVQALDGKFNDAGIQIVTNKKAEVQAAYTELIASCPYQNAQDWCQSKGDNGISNEFLAAMTAQLKEKMTPIVKGSSNSKVIEAWNTSISNFNSANAKLGATEWGAKFKQPEISLDINAYIAECIAKSLCNIMGPKEKLIRSKAHEDKLFQACLNTSKRPIRQDDYKAWKAGKFSSTGGSNQA